MEMEGHEYGGMADLRHYLNGRPGLFAAIPPPPPPPPPDILALAQAQAQHYEMGGSGIIPPSSRGGIQHYHHHHEFHRSDSTTTASVNTAGTGTSSGGLEMDTGGGSGGHSGANMGLVCGSGGGGDCGSGRWPRQETLTLLEIRSRLDSKFKEANQKGPLWDEVSRIMSEEHGYQRTGKKCREKFENLYKYYKKTKEGKAGRQDGKHYRFFRQLEALYGETNNANPASGSETAHHVGSTSFRHNSNTNSLPNHEALLQPPRLCNSLSLSNSFDSSSSEDSDTNDSMDKAKKRRGSRNWKVKIRGFIDTQMRKLMEKQEVWLDKMMKTIEQKEQERTSREEEWRKHETERIGREHRFWANERAWIEARDATLMEGLHKLIGKKELKEGLIVANDNGSETITDTMRGDSWPECEITRLIQLRTSMEPRFQHGAYTEEVIWEEIASKMAYFGYDRSATMCRDKWDSINNYLMRENDCSKKCKEQNSRSRSYFPNSESLSNQGGGYGETGPPNDSCFRFLMGDPENVWENYGLKLSSGENH